MRCRDEFKKNMWPIPKNIELTMNHFLLIKKKKHILFRG